MRATFAFPYTIRDVLCRHRTPCSSRLPLQSLLQQGCGAGILPVTPESGQDARTTPRGEGILPAAFL